MKNNPVRLYGDKRFRIMLKQKALDLGYENYIDFTRDLAKNPDLWNISKKDRKKKGGGGYGLF